MTQIILETIKSELVAKLKSLAHKHDRSLEAEITAILENATENMSNNASPSYRGWSEGFFEKTCGSWEGEQLTKEPQPEYQERKPLL